MRRVVVSLLVLAVVLAGADYLAKDYTAGRIEIRLQRTFDTKRRPQVGIEAFPFVIAALQGTVPALEVDLAQITVEGVSFKEVAIELEEVEFSIGDILSGRMRGVSAEAGRGHALITDRALQRIVAREQPDVSIRLRGGTVTVSTPAVPGIAAAEVELRGNDLVISPEGGLDEIVISLPEITSGLDYAEVEVEASDIKLAFELSKPVIEL